MKRRVFAVLVVREPAIERPMPFAWNDPDEIRAEREVDEEIRLAA